MILPFYSKNKETATYHYKELIGQIIPPLFFLKDGRPGKESYPVAEKISVISFEATGNGDKIFNKAIV